MASPNNEERTREVLAQYLKVHGYPISRPSQVGSWVLQRDHITGYDLFILELDLARGRTKVSLKESDINEFHDKNYQPGLALSSIPSGGGSVSGRTVDAGWLTGPTNTPPITLQSPVTGIPPYTPTPSGRNRGRPVAFGGMPGADLRPLTHPVATPPSQELPQFPPENTFEGETMTTTTTRTWESARESALSQAAKPSRRAPNIRLQSDGALKCNCTMSSKVKMCAHIAAMYLQGRDRHDILDAITIADTGGERHVLQIPIGLGRVFVSSTLTTLVDEEGKVSGEFMVVSPLHPDPPLLLSRHEGMLPYIKFIESELRIRDLFGDLAAAPPDRAISIVAQHCRNGGGRRTHSSQITAKNISGLRYHTDRENFILATVATLQLYARCLSCQEALSGVNDIPEP